MDKDGVGVAVCNRPTEELGVGEVPVVVFRLVWVNSWCEHVPS